MRNRILAITAALLLMTAVACAGIPGIGVNPLWGSILLAAESSPTEDSGVMIVFYKIANEQYLFWTDLTARITDNGDGTWDVTSPQVVASGVNQANVAYDFFKYQEIAPAYDDDGNEIPIYLDDLGLQQPTADDLPHSQHIGKLVAVDPGKARPATVLRKWHGMSFNITCLVSQSVVNMWASDDLNVGDFVVVSFIDEIPDSDELNIAIVVDKVYKSWG